MYGPIDYVVVGFEGNNFDGSILKELGGAIDKGIIDLLGLKVFSKDNDGRVTIMDISSSEDSFLVDLESYLPGKEIPLDQDDIDEAAELLENNTTAGILIIEHLWAKPLKQAIIDANGVLVAEGRIHPDADKELNADD